MQVNSSTTLNSISWHKTKEDTTLNAIGSGKKEDISPAMQAIASMMMSDASVMGQGVQNANESVAMLQIADGTLQNVSAMTNDLETLNVKANSAALNSDQKAMLHNEYNTQVKAINDAMSSASYNGVSLFGKEFSTSMGDSSLSFSIPTLDTSNLQMGDNDALKSFREHINDAFSSIGSSTNAFSSSINALLANQTNTLSAASAISDTDMAESVTKFQQEDLMTQAAILAQVHKNELNQDRVSALLA